MLNMDSITHLCRVQDQVVWILDVFYGAISCLRLNTLLVNVSETCGATLISVTIMLSVNSAQDVLSQSQVNVVSEFERPKAYLGSNK
jgi:hypothetical protein